MFFRLGIRIPFALIAAVVLVSLASAPMAHAWSGRPAAPATTVLHSQTWESG